MAFYITRAVSATAAINVYTNLTNDGTGTNVGGIQVPSPAEAIKEIVFSFALSVETATSVGGNVHLRLSGNGLRDGQQEMTLGGWTSITTGINVATSTAYTKVDVQTDIAVIVGNTVTVAAAQSGVDTGTQEYSCTLIFT